MTSKSDLHNYLSNTGLPGISIIYQLDAELLSIHAAFQTWTQQQSLFYHPEAWAKRLFKIVSDGVFGAGKLDKLYAIGWSILRRAKTLLSKAEALDPAIIGKSIENVAYWTKTVQKAF